MSTADAEIARASLLERFPNGFEEADASGITELAVYTDEVGEAAIRAEFPGAGSESVEEGWGDRWKEFHRPVTAGGLWIGPPWLSPPAGALAVVVDPGRAFRTGAHPTTRACIELLSTLERGSLLDAGCGSGVVAVTAARLGFDPVIAVDSDPIAVEVARETVRGNSVSVDVYEADVMRDDLPRADVVVANIELAVIEALLARTPARRVVASGYIVGQRPEAKGWLIENAVEIDGWAAHVLVARHER